MKQLQQWFTGLNSRERMIVSGGGTALLLIALFLFAWEPLVQQKKQLQTSIDAQQELYRWMKVSAAEAKQLQRSAPRGKTNAGTMRSVINRTVKRSLPGATIKRVDASKNKVQVSIDQVAFDDLIRWLASLQQKNGIQVDSFVSERLPQPGRVNARLTLKAG